MPASMAPGRVPMHSPSTAVKLIVVSTLLRFLQGTEARAAPQVRDDDPPVGDLRRDLGQDRWRCTRRRCRGSRSAPRRPCTSSRGKGTTVATGAWPR